MEQHTFKNVNKCLNTNIYSCLETSGGQGSYLYLNVVHSFDTSVNYTSLATEDSCLSAKAFYMCYSIALFFPLQNLILFTFSVLPSISTN